MTFSADNNRPPRDVGFRAVGVGLVIRASCMGCGQRRLQARGVGKPGPRWRCSHCVAAKREKVPA